MQRILAFLFMVLMITPGVAAGRDRAPAKPFSKRLLYLRAEFADKSIGGGPGGADIADDEWRRRLGKLNETAERYWVYNSYGRIRDFEATCSEVFRLPAALTGNSPYLAGKNVQRIKVDMLRAAERAGLKPDAFDEVILSFPSVKGFPAGALGGGGYVWMPGHDPYDGGFIHEYGHAIGVGHANAIEGGGGRVTYPGEHREGADGLFMMGSEGGVAEMPGRPRRAPINLPMRYKLGFVDERLIHAARSPSRRPIRISAFDRPSITRDLKRKRRLAVVFEHDGREWWVSYAPTLAARWAKESRTGGSGPSVWADGVMVHELHKNITRLLDFTPGSQGGEGRKSDYVDCRDGALRVGQSFTFPNGPTIEPTKTGADRDGVPWIEVRFTPPRR